MSVAVLQRMQELLARLYDAPVEHHVEDYLLQDRKQVTQVTGAECNADEQVVLVDNRDEVSVGVFIDPAVLSRLDRANPWDALEEDNLQDYCTALEGVSHFHYLMWNLSRHRSVSLLELELQADVDKYASAFKLITQQCAGAFPSSLHQRLFDRVDYLPELSSDDRQRYEDANRYAARFCRSLEDRFIRKRQHRPEAWVAELRRFFRHSHQAKLREVTR
jgi:hypothetical protein